MRVDFRNKVKIEGVIPDVISLKRAGCFHEGVGAIT